MKYRYLSQELEKHRGATYFKLNFRVLFSRNWEPERQEAVPILSLRSRLNKH